MRFMHLDETHLISTIFVHQVLLIRNMSKQDWVRLAYINKITNWWPPEKIAASMAVPGYSDYHIYNYIALAFWTYQHGAVDAVSLWDDPLKFFGQGCAFGNSKSEIQAFLKAKYNQHGIKIMISAFGATEFPTTMNINPVECASKLAAYVKANNLDGVDIDWEDNHAMEAGTGEQWLIAFTARLRELLPNHIITHAPQAPYFSSSHYKGGGYMAVHRQVGHLIDFYNVQFYNQGNTTYDTYQRLFIESGGYFPGTSVKEIAEKGVPINKIIVGKPVLQSDATNTGWMDHSALGMAVRRAWEEGKWHGGVMLWQYSSDSNGSAISKIAGGLKDL